MQLRKGPFSLKQLVLRPGYGKGGPREDHTGAGLLHEFVRLGSKTSTLR